MRCWHFTNTFELNELKLNLLESWVVQDLRVRAGVLEDLQHTGAGDVPDLGAELFPVQNHQVLQAVCPRPSQLLVVCGRKVRAWKHVRHRRMLWTCQKLKESCYSSWMFGLWWRSCFTASSFIFQCTSLRALEETILLKVLWRYCWGICGLFVRF